MVLERAFFYARNKMNEMMNVNMLTMSSTGIVELTSNEHSKVMANIRKVLSEVEFSAVYKN